MITTNALVEELLGTELVDIPAPARERMQRLFVDTVGTTYGSLPVSGKELIAYARDVGGSQDAVVIGAGSKSSCEVAAGVNSQLARTMDFEETGPGIHIGPSVVHTVLSVGQRVGASGEEMMATACIVYEINGRFHHARRDGDSQRHNNLCITMAAARLLGFDAETTNLALGLCWNYPIRQTTFHRPPDPGRMSRLGMGNLWSCQDGIQAALLAMHGYGELPDELERRDQEYDLSTMADSPSPFFYTADEIQLKPWPSSRLSQGGIQLSRELMEEHDIEVDDIEQITVHLPWIYRKPHQYNPSPEGYWEAIYSVQWGTALGILDCPAALECHELQRKRNHRNDGHEQTDGVALRRGCASEYDDGCAEDRNRCPGTETHARAFSEERRCPQRNQDGVQHREQRDICNGCELDGRDEEHLRYGVEEAGDDR